MTLGERARKVAKERDDNLRKDVLEAVLKHYKARELARLDVCPLCGCLIGQYTWTITNFAKGLDPIGLSGAQCTNGSCLLHNGIIYEDEGKRLAEWQAGGSKHPVVRGLDEDEKDPNRFKIQLWTEQETIKNATTMMEFKEVSVNPSKDGKIMKFEMKMESTQRSVGTHASSWGHELFEAIEEMGYRIWWMSPDWVSNRLMIIIRKEVVR